MTDIYNAGAESESVNTDAPPQTRTQKKVKVKIKDIKEGEIQKDGEVLIIRQSYLLLFFRLAIGLLMMGFFYGALWLLAKMFSAFGILISPGSNPLILIVVSLAFFLVAAVTYIKWKNTYYTLREKSLDLTAGLFETTTRTLRLDTFAGITIEQGLLGKFLNYGTVFLEYQAKEDSTESLTFFPNPEHYGEIIKKRIKSM